MSRILANKYNINHIWTRIFSVYGPYDGQNTMVINTIRTMIEESKSPDYTKGEQMWDYIYSKDVAKAFYLIGEKGKNNSIYCIAQGDSKQLKEYIKEIRDSINKTISLNLGIIPYNDKQVMNLQADISNLKNDLEFFPEYTFKEGINETIKWYTESCDKNEKS